MEHLGMLSLIYEVNGNYPLVMTNIAIENDHRNSGFPHKQMVDLSMFFWTRLTGRVGFMVIRTAGLPDMAFIFSSMGDGMATPTCSGCIPNVGVELGLWWRYTIWDHIIIL